MVHPELGFAERLADLLRPHGDASLEYITAEMQPYSNAQRPDVVWTPKTGGYARQLFFFEIKISTKPIVHGRGFRNLVEHLEFASEALGSPIAIYVFVTAAEIPEFSERYLAENRVHIVPSTTDPDDVLTYLRKIGAIT